MSRKILIVDEKPFMVRLIQHHLERAGYELLRARNNQEAADMIAKQSPELVVMDGDEQHPSGPGPAHSLPTIRMTDVPQKPGGNGSNDVVLTKPFSPTHLVAEVKRLMPNSKPK